jgi:nicotinamidase-related amidase
MKLDRRRTASIAVHHQNDVTTSEGAFGASFTERTTATGVVPTPDTPPAAARASGAQAVHTRVALQPGYGGDHAGNVPLLATASWRGCLVEGTSTAAIVDELTPFDGETMVTHQGVSGFVGSELETVLRGRGTNTVVITGLATKMSVESTARGAGDLGYGTIVVSDARSAATPEARQGARDKLRMLGTVATLADAPAALKTSVTA